MPVLEETTDDAESARTGSRKAYFATAAEAPIEVPVYSRERLRAGQHFAGPAIVEQYDSTTVVCPEQVATVDGYGNLVITMKKGTVDD
jgi:N-methylhydantoinase A